MSLATNFGPFNRLGACCAICRYPIQPGEEQFSREGCTHEGFHPLCVLEWLKTRNECPIDHRPILAESVRIFVESHTTRTERIWYRCKPALINAAYAGAIGLVAAGTGAGARVGAVIAAAGAVGSAVAAGAAITLGIDAAVLAEVKKSAVVGVIGVGAAVALAVETVAEAEMGRATLVGAIGAGAVGVVVGAGTDLLWGRRVTNVVARQNIGWPLLISSYLVMIGIRSGVIPSEPAQVISLVSLGGGAIAGALSFFRR